MTNKVNYKELHKEIVKVNEEIRNFFGETGVEIIASYDWNSPIKAKINWAGFGSKDVESVKKFMAALQLATELAENFKYNGFVEEF